MRTSAVFACVDLIGSAIATLPVGAFHHEERRGRRVGIPDDPPALLREPYPEIDLVDWVTQLAVSLLLRGNAYGYITTVSDDAWPVTILPLHPDTVQPRQIPGRRAMEYHVRGLPGTERPWPHGRIWHIRGLTLPGEPLGVSPIECARQAIGLALAAEEFGAEFFGDRAYPGGVLEVPDDFNDTPADRARAQRILREFERTHSRARRVALLTNGAKWNQVSISPNEAQFLETRRYQLGDIARIFRVPPHMIGDVEKSTSWGTGIEQQGIGFVTYTLRPWIVRLEQALTRLLPGDQFAKCNVSGLLRGDLKSRYEAYAIGRAWGWLTVNDILDLEDEMPVGDGDARLQPLNMRDAAAPTLKERTDAARALVSVGYDPAEALEACGLPPITHTGLVPVTVQEEPAAAPEPTPGPPVIDPTAPPAPAGDDEQEE